MQTILSINMLCAEFSIVKVKNFKLCLNTNVHVQSLQFYKSYNHELHATRGD